MRFCLIRHRQPGPGRPEPARRAAQRGGACPELDARHWRAAPARGRPPGALPLQPCGRQRRRAALCALPGGQGRGGRHQDICVCGAGTPRDGEGPPSGLQARAIRILRLPGGLLPEAPGQS